MVKYNLMSKLRIALVSILLLTISANFGYAQDSSLGNWLIYFGNKKVNSSWNIHNEVQYRNYNIAGDLEQLLLRVGLGYNLTENNNLLLGYGFIHSQNYIDGSEEKESVNEHRIYQQFINKHKIARTSLQHRVRLEERFVEDNFKMRFRYFLAINVPFNNKEMIDNTVYLSAYNEIFLNFDENVFDRNRIYGGLGYKVNTSFRFELGYMTQIFEDSMRDQMNVIAFVNF